MADWDNPFSHWDDGETWDAGQSPNPGDVTPYLDKITSEHNQQPKYMAMLAGVFQPLADILAVGNSLQTMYDIDNAGGIQLDAIGLWVGRTRQLSEPLTDVFFTFNSGPGFNKGIFKSKFDPTTTLISLPDEQYRTLLKATIAANHWDGTVDGAYAAYALVFGPSGYQLLIIDNQDMTMQLILGGPVPDAVTLALFLGGYLSLKPAGVRVSSYVVTANPTKKIFAFNAPSTSPILGGFNVAAFATHYPGV